MRTYSGYTVEEVEDMIDGGYCPVAIHIDYQNSDYDGYDGYYELSEW